MNEKILIIGATGNVGSELARLLSAKGEAVKAATRKPDDYPDLPGVKAVYFDYDQPDTFAAALEDANRFFIIARNADAEADKVMIPFLEQAEASGVEHAVLMTAMGIDQAPAEIPYRRAELHLLDSGMDHTILRPNWFMQNFYPGFIYPMIQQSGAFYLPAGDAKSSLIDTRDIAAVAATALTEEGHRNQEYTLTGGEALNYYEAAAIVSEAAGRDITYVPVSDDDMRQSLAQAGWGPAQVEMMVNLFATVRQGYTAPVLPTVSQVLGRPPISFEQYAADHAEAWQE